MTALPDHRIALSEQTRSARAGRPFAPQVDSADRWEQRAGQVRYRIARWLLRVAAVPQPQPPPEPGRTGA